MCGIIGYIGYDEAKNILIKGLKTLEYRGYDSAGIAVYNPDYNQCLVSKCEGRVDKLKSRVADVKGKSGIGHTRWATHGEVSDTNSHPHKFGNVTIVHNGIIENYESLMNTLGVASKLKSGTDSEVVAALIDKCYEKNPVDAIISSVKKLRGTYALAIMFDDEPDAIYAVRNVSPVVCCQNDSGCYIASDIIAIAEYCPDYFVLPELTVAKITKDKIEIVDFAKNFVEPEMSAVNWDIKNSGKCGYPFYMEKEIMEQPDVIRNTLHKKLRDNIPDFSSDNVDESIFAECKSISIVACGTAMHSGLIGKQLIEKNCGVPVTVYMASEFIYCEPIISRDTLVICVSQSGETIDTLEALKYAQRQDAKILSIVNVRGSVIAKLSENVIYTDAGPEIAVASTKAYTSQLVTFYLITAKMAYMRGCFNSEGLSSFMDELKKVPKAVEEVFSNKEKIHHIAGSLLTAEHAFMIGRGLDYPALLEASLKLKEISYIHSEAFASGELKHGTIALITKNTPVIALMTQKYLASKQVSNIKEVQSRGAQVITVCTTSLKSFATNDFIELPDMDDEFTVIPAVSVMQLLAYYVSSDKGLDVDKPRNLAKVVTVE